MPLWHPDYVSRSKREPADSGRSPPPRASLCGYKEKLTRSGGCPHPPPRKCHGHEGDGKSARTRPCTKNRSHSLPHIRAVPPPATPGGLKPFPSSCAVSEVLFSFAEMPNQCTSNQPRVTHCGGSSHMMCPAGINALSVSLVNLHRAPPGELQ